MARSKWRRTATLALMLSAPLAASAGTAFWVPVTDGATWAFLESGQYQNSEGTAYGWGPRLELASFVGVDEQIIDHRANFKLLGENDYYRQDGAGLFRLSEGDPRDPSAEYRYYTDPEPFFITAPLDIGQEHETTGIVRGQYAAPGGMAAWTGEWRVKLANLGPEVVTVPLGTFQTTKFELDSERTHSFDNGATSRDYWTEQWWLVEGVLVAQVTGAGGGTSDYDGNGTVDRWYQEQLTMVATQVPEVATAPLAAFGLLLLGILMRWRGGMARRAQPSSIDPRRSA